jgi:selenocysteine lyase/cysteine desulfurase
MDAQALRDEFPVTRRVAYLNAGTCGPVPARAVEAAQEELRHQAAEGRLHAHFERRSELQARQRAAYAALLGCQPGEVALTTSTSEGVAIALAGLELGAGDEVLISDAEHPGLIGPVQAARDLRGVTVREVPLAHIADAVRPATALVACSHVSWVTGETAPAELGRLEVPVLLDGAQGVGAVPTDVLGLGCDLYAGSGQKWLCGPDGSGMLYVAPHMRERVAAWRRSYSSFADVAGGLEAPLHPDARRHDAPAMPAEASAFAVAAHDVLAAHGWDDVHARARALAGRLAGELRERGVEVEPRSETTLVSWHSGDAAAERDRLAGMGIAIRDLPGRDLLRASVGAWNDDSDLERLLEALAGG